MDVKIVVFLSLVCLAGYGCDACGENQHYTTCASACVPACTNLHPACTDQCAGAKCQCNSGYVRNSQNGCVLPDQCP